MPAMDSSRESTATLPGDVLQALCPIEALVDTLEPEQVPDQLLDASENSDVSMRRLIMAVDFGTTYSAIAYVALEPGETGDYLDPARIHTIQNYPADVTFGSLDDDMRSEVPTEVIYPLDRDFRKKEGLDTQETEAPQSDVPTPGTGLTEAHGDPGDPLAIFGGHRDDDSDRMSIDETTSFRWGYETHEAWGRSATHVDPKNRPLARFKLLLDSSPRTQTIRDELNVTLQELKKKKVIKDSLDVIADFLTCLLRHAKSELENAGLFVDDYKLETILCVPAIWSQKACRDMQTAMAKAMGRAGFQGVDVKNNSIENLFIVSEPEAAAAFVLGNSRDIMVIWLSPFSASDQTSARSADAGHSQAIHLSCWMQVRRVL